MPDTRNVYARGKMRGDTRSRALPNPHAIAVMIVTVAVFYLYTRPWIRMELVSLLLLVALLLIFYVFPFVSDAARITDVIDCFAPRTSQITYYRYLPDGWHLSTAADCADCRYFNIHATRQHDPDYAAAARAVACIEATR